MFIYHRTLPRCAMRLRIPHSFIITHVTLIVLWKGRDYGNWQSNFYLTVLHCQLNCAILCNGILNLYIYIYYWWSRNLNDEKYMLFNMTLVKFFHVLADCCKQMLLIGHTKVWAGRLSHVYPFLYLRLVLSISDSVNIFWFCNILGKCVVVSSCTVFNKYGT